MTREATREARECLQQSAKQIDRAIGRLAHVDALEDGTDCSEIRAILMSLRDSVNEVDATIRRSRAAFAWPKATENATIEEAAAAANAAAIIETIKGEPK